MGVLVCVSVLCVRVRDLAPGHARCVLGVRVPGCACVRECSACVVCVRALGPRRKCVLCACVVCVGALALGARECVLCACAVCAHALAPERRAVAAATAACTDKDAAVGARHGYPPPSSDSDLGQHPHGGQHGPRHHG